MGSMDSAKLGIDVVAGIVPGTPMPELTRRFFLTSAEWHADGADQVAMLAELNGRAQGYAAMLMLQPDRYNWVKTEWVWF